MTDDDFIWMDAGEENVFLYHIRGIDCVVVHCYYQSLWIGLGVKSRDEFRDGTDVIAAVDVYQRMSEEVQRCEVVEVFPGPPKEKRQVNLTFVRRFDLIYER